MAAVRAPAKKTVELFYDVISPYSWIGFETLCRYRSKWNIDLKLRPFFYAAVLKTAENKAPIFNKRKMEYIMKDLGRLAHFHKIPIKPPSDPFTTLFKKGSLPAQRLLTAISMNENDDSVEKISRLFWLRIWSKDKDITEPASFLEVMKTVGLNDEKARRLIGKIKDQDVKDKLQENTQTALSHGAFGAPKILVHADDGKKHAFFGSDRFHIIAEILGEKHDFNPADEELSV
ncbi:glutathione S-transferase kappa 1-like [Glandiceps talaboti]